MNGHNEYIPPLGSDIEYEFQSRELQMAEALDSLEYEARHAEHDRFDERLELIQD